MSSDTKHLHWLSDWSEFAFSLCFEIKAKVFLKYSFMIRKPTLSYGKWTLSWRHGRGWEHHDWEISHFLTFTLLLIHLGLFPPIFFSAVLRDRAQEVTRWQCSRSTELVFSWAWSARKHPIFQTGSSLQRKNIHSPTTAPATSEYLQKFANTLYAQISWCFLLGTLQDTMFRRNFDDPRVGEFPDLCGTACPRQTTCWESYRDKQGKGCAFPPIQQVPVEGGQMHPPNQETTEWQELTQPKLLMESLRSLQVPDFCSS